MKSLFIFFISIVIGNHDFIQRHGTVITNSSDQTIFVSTTVQNTFNVKILAPKFSNRFDLSALGTCDYKNISHSEREGRLIFKHLLKNHFGVNSTRPDPYANIHGSASSGTIEVIRKSDYPTHLVTSDGKFVHHYDKNDIKVKTTENKGDDRSAESVKLFDGRYDVTATFDCSSLTPHKLIRMEVTSSVSDVVFVIKGPIPDTITQSDLYKIIKLRQQRIGHSDGVTYDCTGPKIYSRESAWPALHFSCNKLDSRHVLLATFTFSRNRRTGMMECAYSQIYEILIFNIKIRQKFGSLTKFICFCIPIYLFRNAQLKIDYLTKVYLLTYLHINFMQKINTIVYINIRVLFQKKLFIYRKYS